MIHWFIGFQSPSRSINRSINRPKTIHITPWLLNQSINQSINQSKTTTVLTYNCTKPAFRTLEEIALTATMIAFNSWVKSPVANNKVNQKCRYFRPKIRWKWSEDWDFALTWWIFSLLLQHKSCKSNAVSADSMNISQRFPSMIVTGCVGAHDLAEKGKKKISRKSDNSKVRSEKVKSPSCFAEL